MNDDDPDWSTLVETRFALREAASLFDRNNLGMRRLALRHLTPLRGGIPFLAARTFWGEPILVFNGEEVSQQIFTFGVFETPLANFMTRFLKPGDTVFDVGAHVGFFSLLATRLVGHEGSVHAFEPTPTTFSLLKRNVGWHPAATVNRAAAWSEPGNITLRALGNRLSAFNSAKQVRLTSDELENTEIREIEVSSIVLDEYVKNSDARPVFVKIDVENAEREVLSGMQHLLDELRPVISIEVGDQDGLGSHEIGSSRELLEHVMAHGYLPVETRRNRFHLHALKDDWHYAYDNILMVPIELLPDSDLEPGVELMVLPGEFTRTP